MQHFTQLRWMKEWQRDCALIMMKSFIGATFVNQKLFNNVLVSEEEHLDNEEQVIEEE